jgi:putative ABC transport system substrate-binding protein
MRRREVFALIVGAATVGSGYVRAQPKGKPIRVGYLAPGRNQRLLDAFLRGLRDTGYIEGDNLALDYRSADGRPDLLAFLASDLVRRSPDVIVTLGAAATRAARDASSTIPVVFAPAGDPVQLGFAQSLARPGGNLTGLSLNTWVLNQKRLEIMKETFPNFRRIAILSNGSNLGNRGQWEQLKAYGEVLGLELLPVMVAGIDELAAAFAMIAGSGVDALATLPDATFDMARARIVALAAEHRLITIYEHRAFVEAGGLMSYGPNLDRVSERAATFVDRLAEGARAADLPVEQPDEFELLVNLKTARVLGSLDLDPILLRADQVIE